MTSSLRCLLSALAIIGVTGVHANAATLTVSGGSSEILNANFNPGGWANFDGITAGVSSITVFSGLLNNGGVSVDADARITFTYMGTEAANTNLTFFTAPLQEIFSNKTSIAGTTLAIFDPVAAGTVPFKFTSQGSSEAVNGGSIASNLLLGLIQVSPTRVYAFLEDIAIGGDRDLDDMVIRIDVAPSQAVGEVPVPLALPLFAAGLGVFGFLSRRRRQAALPA